MALEVGRLVARLELNDSGFTSGLKRAEGEMGRSASAMGRLDGQLGKVGLSMKGLAGMAGVGGLAAGMSAVIKQGNELTNNLNTLRAAGGATEAQMAQVSATAKQLGADNAIVGASAGSAAAAMTELVKGGMSVEQSMEAARGTLQLAAAAQIDAAQAATIQSSALQAFSLSASDAGRVSDILANAANASSAEIGDVAAAMQQAGTVANQFGVDVDDTATAIAMFANAGIRGSDAGTLLKTALLALTDQGNPAQGAMEELGLTVYDMQGKFVGLPSLFEQLATAQKKMTPEAYQAASAVLFGSDAMRMAGIAAQQGSEGFNTLNTAVNKTGGAAAMAEAKTRGLPGAINNLQNQAETAAVSLYELVDGPLASLADFSAEGIERVPGALSNVASAAAPVGSAVGSALSTIPGDVQAALAALVALRVTGFGDALTGRISSVGGGFRQLGADMAEQQRYAAAFGHSLGSAGAAMAALEARSPALGRAASAYRDVNSRAMESAGLHMAMARSVDSTAGAFHLATAGATRFGGVVGGTVAAGMSTLKTGLGGVVSALGGPWMIGLAAAGLGVSRWMQSNAEAAQAVAQHKADVDTLATSLDQVTGAITEATRATEAKRLADEGAFAAGREFGLSEQTIANAAMGNADAQRAVDDAMRARLSTTAESIASQEVLRENIENGGITVGDFTSALMLNQDALDKLSAAGIDTGWVLRHRTEDMVTLSDAVGASNGRITEAQRKFNELAAATGKAGLTAETTSEAMRLMGDAVVSVPDNKTVIVSSLTEPARAELERLGFTVQAIPGSKDLKVTSPGALDLITVLQTLGMTVNTLPDGHIEITDTTPENIAAINALTGKVHEPKNGVVTINSADVDRARGHVDALNNIKTQSTHTVIIGTVNRGGNDLATDGVRVGQQYADGGIRSFADGGTLPDQAVIQQPKGNRGLVQWAENETGGEAFIPLAKSKRRRSLSIWSEVGNRLGVDPGKGDMLTKFADGGIMASGLINFAKGVEGKPYVWGGVNWGDCSGAVSAIANYVSGRSPFGSRFATASEREGLASRGFKTGRGGAGDLKVGWVNGGPAGGHTAATLPNGVNFEMGGGRGNGQYGGSAAGADDPSFTDHAYFPMERFADIDAAVSGDATKSIAEALGTGNPSMPNDPGSPAASGLNVTVAGGAPTGSGTPVFVTNWPGGSNSGTGAVAQLTGETTGETSGGFINGVSIAGMIANAAGRSDLVMPVETFADGGFAGLENHQAQIAGAGSWRVWGEPETGGEAYIPLASHKRARSTAILAETAKRFGYQLGAGVNLAGSAILGGGLDTVWGGPSLSEVGVDTTALKNSLQPGVTAHAEAVGQQILALLTDLGAAIDQNVDGTLAQVNAGAAKARQHYAGALI